MLAYTFCICVNITYDKWSCKYIEPTWIPISDTLKHSDKIISLKLELLPSATTPASDILQPDKSRDVRDDIVASSSTPASVTCSQ